jgi:hypothetical protein
MLLIWFAFEALLYRSGLYVHLAEPDSNTGAVVNALLQLQRQYQPGARHVLVFGNSRIGEGFSAPIANDTSTRLRYINLAVPGSTVRTWSYLLRAIDRAGYEYEAVVVGTLYRDDTRSLLADWPLDPAHHAALIDLRDAIAYPREYTTPDMRERARHAVLLPALALRRDTQAWLTAPWTRARKLLRTRPAYLAASATYPGRSERLPELHFDADARVTDWRDATPAQRSLIESHLETLRAPVAPDIARANLDYQIRWLGAIADRAAQRGAQLILLQMPRGPYSAALPATPDTPPVLAALATHDNLIGLPADLLAPLEQPEFFFDGLHANRAGRERLSRILAERVDAVLRQEPH